MATKQGWHADTWHRTASYLVSDICKTLDSLAAQNAPEGLPQWLISGGHTEGDNGKILISGVPMLCPKWTEIIKQATEGNFERSYGNGDYEVGKEIKPGKYRTSGDLKNCYWARLTISGEIIDNNFAPAAREITVTIQKGDGLFTTKGCGAWKAVK
ncbi:hypothetical protein ACFWA9_09810 [Kitasatospora sp. NPDC059973]|uniref:hypothetical protein n=1 Tax=Kitasatospora sp. NPDC059973 TaxID=3347020 RepID=UPI00367F9428